MLRRSVISFSAIIVVLLVVGCIGPPQPGQGSSQGFGAATPSRTPRASTNNPSNSTAVSVRPTVTVRPSVITPIPAPTVVVPTVAPGAAQKTSSPQLNPTAATNPSSDNASSSQSQANPTLSAPSASTATLDSLRGKILFFSDRAGSLAQLYVMDADGSNAHICDCSEVLQAMVKREVSSPDKQQFLFVKTVGGSARTGAGDAQIWRHNNKDNTDEPVTGGAPGFPGVDYDPVWSPDSRHIAWVTEANSGYEGKNGPDEIYLYDAVENSNVRLTESHGEWYKHPSFSSDGSKIAYWTNVQSAEKKQIWIMNLDGTGAHNISQNSFNDYDPYWVK